MEKTEKIKKYEIWINILTKLDFNKEYKIKKDREDYDFFVDSLKEFSKMWWNFLVYEKDGHMYFNLLDPVEALLKMRSEIMVEQKFDEKDKKSTFVETDTKNGTNT